MNLWTMIKDRDRFHLNWKESQEQDMGALQSCLDHGESLREHAGKHFVTILKALRLLSRLPVISAPLGLVGILIDPVKLEEIRKLVKEAEEVKE